MKSTRWLRWLVGAGILGGVSANCTLLIGSLGGPGGTGGSGGIGATTASSGTGGISSSSTNGTGAASTTSGTGGAGCTMDAQCDDMNPCTTDICDAVTGACSHTNVPDGIVPGYVDTVKDCRTEMCAAGVEVSVADDTDVPSSPTPCVTNSCSMMNVVMTDVMTGVSCGGVLKCDGAGNCVGCDVDGDCPNPGNYCDTTGNTCLAKGGPGATCAGGDQCLSGACCVDGLCSIQSQGLGTCQ